MSEMLLAGRRPVRFGSAVAGVQPDALARVRTVLDACETNLGERVRSAEEITCSPNPDKAVLLVRFESGLRVKVYISVPGNECFERSSRLMRAAGSVNFPKVLIRGDGWAAFEWVEGSAISEQAPTPDIVGKAARLLAAIHHADVGPEASAPGTLLDEARRKLEEKLPVLASNEIISAAQSRRVTGLCDSLSADDLNISLTHGDFSPSNLVVRGGEVYPVDNEKIRLHVTDYDVCRAVTFWDEWNLSGGALLDSYSKQSGRMFAPDSLFFWGVFDLVYRISYRVSSFGEFNRFCIGRLRRILRTGAFL